MSLALFNDAVSVAVTHEKLDGSEGIFENMAYFEVLCQHRLEWIAIWRINTPHTKPIKRGNNFLSCVNIIFNKKDTHWTFSFSLQLKKKYKASEARSAFVTMFYILLGPTNRDTPSPYQLNLMALTE
jgi:hypothetical protein